MWSAPVAAAGAESRATSMPGSPGGASCRRPAPSCTKSSAVKLHAAIATSGEPGSGRPTEPIFLPRAFASTVLASVEAYSSSTPTGPNRSTSRRQTSRRRPLPARRRTGLFFSPTTGGASTSRRHISPA
jgi:hypothetical protein